MEKIELTPLERERYDIIRSCSAGDITNKEASVRLGLEIRHIQRLKRAIKDDGEKGAVHKAKGKRPSNATDLATVKKVVSFFEHDKHKDFGPTFAQEKLADIGITMSTEALRLLMIEKKLWKSKPRRGPQIKHEWRERKECSGELVQFDGSYHDWFENKGEECLLAAIDDATGNIMRAVFDDNEGVRAVFRFWLAYLEAHGRPVAIYLDKFSTYKINHKKAVDNPEFMTQFERAMKELDVRVICAHSAEAKGRVERLFETLQDRMVKEMRLQDIKTRDTANTFVADKYIPDHNKRFSVIARSEHDAHRPLTDELRARLPAIFSVQDERVVNNDYTIQFKTRWFQLDAVQKTPVYKRDKVVVEERLDGTLHIRLKDVYLAYTELPMRPKKQCVPVVALTRQKPDWKPTADHPWRNGFLGK